MARRKTSSLTQISCKHPAGLGQRQVYNKTWKNSVSITKVILIAPAPLAIANSLEMRRGHTGSSRPWSEQVAWQENEFSKLRWKTGSSEGIRNQCCKADDSATWPSIPLTSKLSDTRKREQSIAELGSLRLTWGKTISLALGIPPKLSESFRAGLPTVPETSVLLVCSEHPSQVETWILFSSEPKTLC